MCPTKRNPGEKIFPKSSTSKKKIKIFPPDLPMEASMEIQEAPPKGRSKVQVTAIMVALSVSSTDAELKPHIRRLIRTSYQCLSPR